MTRKRLSEEDLLNIFRQIELELAARGTVETSVQTAGIDKPQLPLSLKIKYRTMRTSPSMFVYSAALGDQSC